MSHEIHLTIHKSWLLTSNARGHWAKRSGTIRNLRTLGRAEAVRQLQGLRLDRARIEMWLTFPDHRRRDVGNLAPTAKALVDGLVDAGLLPDDDWRHLVGPDLRINARGRSRPEHVDIRMVVHPLGAVEAP